MEKFKNYEFLLFDADRTLFDFDASEKAAFYEVAPKYGITPNDEVHKLYCRLNNENWEALERGEFTKERILVRRYEQLFESLNIKNQSAENINRDYLAALADKSFVFGESEPLLREMKKRGKKIYLVTNGVKFVQDGRIARSPLKNLFDGVFISEEIGYEKPDIRFFAAVEKGIPGFDKSRAVVIGDSISSDIKGANNYGLDCIWLNEKGAPAPQNLKITVIIKSLNELYDILK